MGPKLHDAVIDLYPNVKRVTGNDVHSLEVLDTNNNLITIVPDDVTNHLATMQAAANTAAQAAVAAKASVITKLTALGLTSDEIAHLIG